MWNSDFYHYHSTLSWLYVRHNYRWLTFQFHLQKDLSLNSRKLWRLSWLFSTFFIRLLIIIVTIVTVIIHLSETLSRSIALFSTSFWMFSISSTSTLTNAPIEKRWHVYWFKVMNYSGQWWKWSWDDLIMFMHWKKDGNDEIMLDKIVRRRPDHVHALRKDGIHSYSKQWAYVGLGDDLIMLSKSSTEVSQRR